jgi:hypothetical protein
MMDVRKRRHTSTFFSTILSVKFWFAVMVSRFFGKVNLDDGIFAVLGMSPIGAPLQEPEVICCPFVSGVAGRVFAQKLIKLLKLVSDGNWPSTGGC